MSNIGPAFPLTTRKQLWFGCFCLSSRGGSMGAAGHQGALKR